VSSLHLAFESRLSSATQNATNATKRHKVAICGART
jgi:hypothetical protein